MHYISIKLHVEVHTLWLSKPSGWMEASVFLRTLKTKNFKKDGKFHCRIRLRFYLTMTSKILLRLYHCQIRPNQSLCTHWNSVKVYWTDVLTPPPLSRATIDYKSKLKSSPHELIELMGTQLTKLYPGSYNKICLFYS